MWDAQFNLCYNSNGGITLESVKGMKKGKFLHLLRKLAKVKEEENKAIERASKGHGSTSPKRSGKYLGKL